MKPIQSLRTNLRRLTVADLDNMQKLESNPQIMKFIPARVPQTIEQTKLRLQGQVEKQPSYEPFGIWAVELKKDKSFVGWFMLRPTDHVEQLEIGFMIVQDFWNQGLTTEVCESLIQFARQYPAIKKIIAKTTLDNVASQRTLQKLQFMKTDQVMNPEPVFGGEIAIQNFELNL